LNVVIGSPLKQKYELTAMIFPTQRLSHFELLIGFRALFEPVANVGLFLAARGFDSAVQHQPTTVSSVGGERTGGVGRRAIDFGRSLARLFQQDDPVPRQVFCFLVELGGSFEQATRNVERRSVPADFLRPLFPVSKDIAGGIGTN